MKIYEVSERPAKLVQQLIQVWEKSVRATHLFLSDEEVKAIKKYVPQALSGIAHLLIAENEAGAFRAVVGGEGERMLVLYGRNVFI